MDAFLEISKNTVPIILPLHPRTKNILKQYFINIKEESGVKIIDPVGYIDMISLEKNASVIVTDSGGIQKEAFYYKVPCVTLRDETEWVETVNSGWNTLTPPNSKKNIIEAINVSKNKKGDNSSMYGNGSAAKEIYKIINEHFHKRYNSLVNGVAILDAL